MPINNNLPKIVHKSSNLLDTTIDTHYKLLERDLKAILLEGSFLSWEDLKKYIHKFVDATWEMNLDKEVSEDEKEKILIKMFKCEHLPGAFKTFHFTFLVTGMTLIGTTHYLRHEGIVFSAVCTGDRPLLQDNYMIPETQFMKNLNYFIKIWLIQRKSLQWMQDIFFLDVWNKNTICRWTGLQCLR